MNGLVKRKYTGFNGNAKGKKAGTEEFMRQLIKRTKGALWNNGTYGIRNARGSSKPSNHGTARVGDASYRFMKVGKGHPKGRQISIKVIQKIVANAAEFGLEMLIDYQFGDFGRAYQCSRDDWKVYTKLTEVGGGTGDWYHYELSEEFATCAAKVKAAFDKIFGPLPV